MPVCHLASIVMDDVCIAYFGPEGAEWRAPLDHICAVGELRSAQEDGHYLALLVDRSGVWLQAPARAAGMDQVIEKLARHLHHPMKLVLAGAPIDSSLVLWPAVLAGEPMFERDARGHTAVCPRVLEAVDS